MSYAEYKQPTKADLIERRVEKTCRQVKQRDVFLTLTVLLTCMVAYFFLFALSDHWVFKGGFSILGRQFLFFGGLAAAGIYAACRIFPLLWYSINPVYAAKILESHRPTMKNTLINWIFLRRSGADSKQNPLHTRMLDGVATKAVRDLDEVPTEMVVDHTAIIRWGIGLVVLVVFLALYTLFSPKSPFSSFARLAMPFSNISTPTQVRFLEITPGDATVAQGETTTVTAHIEGVRKKPVYLYYSTNDGRLHEQIVPMAVPDGDFRFECRFPPGKSGFEQGITYQIGVGRERSAKYRFNVQSPQIFEVQSITYKYPAYTGLPDQTVQGTGEIRAVEGTQVVITAKSNFPLKSAAFVPNGEEKEGKPLTIDSKDDKSATFSFYLNSLASDPNKPECQSYVLRGYDSDRNTNRNPSVYRIEMLKDKPPKISWVDPPKEQLQIPQNGFTEVRATAEDADFGLRFIRIHFDINGKTLAPMELLPNTPAAGPTKYSGIVNIAGTIKPDTLHLDVGDEVEFWAEAVDTLLPKGNTAITDRLSFVVVPPKPGADQKDANEKQQQKKEEQQKEQEQKQQEQKEQKSEQNQGEEGKDSGEQKTGENDSQTAKDDSQQQEKKNQGKDDKKSEQPNQDKNQKQEQKQDGEQQKNDGAQGQEDSQEDQQGGNAGGNQPGEQEKTEGDANGPQQGGRGNSDKTGRQDGDSEMSGDSGGEQDAQQKSGPNDKPQGGAGEGSPDSGQTSGNEPTGTKNNGQNGGQSKEGPLDPDSQPGDVFDKVLDQMKKKGRETDPNKADPSDGPRKHSDELDPTKDRLSDKGTAPQEMPTDKIKGDKNTPKQEAYKTADDNPNAAKQQADPNKQIVDDPTQKNATQPGEEQSKDSNESNDAKNSKEPGMERSEIPGQNGGEQSKESNGPKESKEPGTERSAVPGQEQGQASKEPGNGDQQSQSASGKQGKQTGGTGNTSMDQLGDNPDQPMQNDPNLDFKEKQTSLALRYLEEEAAKKQPDPELLKQLGWSKDDLKAFLEKWKAMSDQAQKAAPGSKEDKAWKEMLRSLGPARPGRETSVNARTTNEDRATATGSRRYNPPENLKNRANAYNEGIAQ